MDWVAPLVTLTAMEIVLGIDNIVFLAVLVGRLPPENQRLARNLGLALALAGRLGLLFAVKWVMSLSTPLFHLSQIGIIPRSWLEGAAVDAVSARDLILIGGGLFLIAKSTREIHKKLEGPEEGPVVGHRTSNLFGVLAQIAVLDLIFSLDSVISAVGMAKELWIMVTAMVVAVGFMLVFAGGVSRFVERHPTVKMLAMSFLVLIGVMLVAEGLGTHMSKGYIYVAMAFSLIVELLNMRARSKAEKAASSGGEGEHKGDAAVASPLHPAGR